MGGEQIDLLTVSDALLPGMFPANAGLGGAARGLERELKGAGATQEEKLMSD